MITGERQPGTPSRVYLAWRLKRTAKVVITVGAFLAILGPGISGLIRGATGVALPLLGTGLVLELVGGAIYLLSFPAEGRMLVRELREDETVAERHLAARGAGQDHQNLLPRRSRSRSRFVQKPERISND